MEENKQQTYLGATTKDESISYALSKVKNWGVLGVAVCITAKLALGILAGNRS